MKPCMEIWKDEYLANNELYYNHVTKFVEYLKLPNVNKANQPAMIDKNVLVDCVEYYVNEGNIKSVNSLDSHLQSIKAFYNFLLMQGYYGQNIVPSADYSDFKGKLAEKYALKDTVIREWIPNSDIEMILDRIDNYFETTEYNKLGKENMERYVHWNCLRIYIKLSLLAPYKKSTLLAVKFSDFFPNFRKINIKDICIMIPNGLRYNLVQAISFIKSSTGKEYTEDDILFNYLSNEIIGKIDKKGTMLNQWFCSFLKVHNLLDVPKKSKSYPLEVIANTTIHNMVSHGTNPAYISRITGITIASLEKKYYKEKEPIKYDVTMETQINNEIAKCSFYNFI